MLVITCLSCKKEWKDVYISDPILKSAIDFKEGSYFVYKDRVSGFSDTCVVTLNQLYTNTDDRVKERYECKSVTLAKSWPTRKFEVNLQAGCASNRMNKIGVGLYFVETNIYSNNSVVTAFNVPQQSGYTYTNTTFKGIHLNFQIDSVSYENVFEYQTEWPHNSSTSYFSLQYGLIRMVTHDKNKGYEHDWILINSKIIR